MNSSLVCGWAKSLETVKRIFPQNERERKMDMKRIALSFICILLLAASLCSCFLGGITQKSFVDGKKAPQLEPSDIESVTLRHLWSETDILFTAEQLEEFTALFNDSIVHLRDGGTTPDYVLVVILKNGTEFHLIDSESILEIQFKKIEGNSDFERNYDIKIENDELIQYIKETMQEETT